MPSLRFFAYKIKIIFTVAFAILSLPFNLLRAQEINVERDYESYVKTADADSLYRFVDLSGIDSRIKFDLRYATKRNFTGKKLYPSIETTCLRMLPAQALVRVLAEISKRGYGLLVFDAYRPYSVTQAMWILVHDERYVANPARGSNHNKGLAIDLTLYELSTGKPLEMGTGFDNFTDSAHHDFRLLSDSILANRQLLKTVMEQAGFSSFSTEWWHYSWPNDHDYAVMDIPFNKLLRVRRSARK